MAALHRHPGIRTFLLVWVGQLVSLVGSGLTAFSLGVWIYQRTDSTTQYALVPFCAAAPPLVVLPLLGPLIDRWDRKRLLVACDLVGAAATAVVGLLAWLGSLSLAHACVIVAVTSSAAALQWPAYSATVTLLVPRDQLGRASGMTQFAFAVSQVIAPLLAGALITLVGLVGVTVLDFATFLFSTTLLLVAAIPPGAPATGEPHGYWRDLPFGWSYVFSHAGLAALLLMFAAVNFFCELAAVLFTPLVLNVSTPAALGTILAVGGIGMIGGGALLSVWGGPRRPALGAVIFSALSGAAVAAAGFTVSVPLLAAAVFVFFFCQPLQTGSSQVLWQRTVPAELQGRHVGRPARLPRRRPARRPAVRAGDGPRGAAGRDPRTIPGSGAGARHRSHPGRGRSTGAPFGRGGGTVPAPATTRRSRGPAAHGGAGLRPKLNSHLQGGNADVRG